MSPFSVTVQRVPDRELGPLLSQLSRAGYDNPTIEYVHADDGLDDARDAGQAEPGAKTQIENTRCTAQRGVFLERVAVTFDNFHAIHVRKSGAQLLMEFV